MCGGEPFLMKNLTRLIENIISKDRAKDIKLHYNSNGSIYPDFLIEHWKQFQCVTLQLSIDNIGARFELERGGNWVEVEKNIKDLIALRLPNLEIFLMPTISIMNVLYLDEIEDWANNLGLKINYSFLSSPEYLSISMLTDRAKQLIFTKYRLNQSPGIEKTLDAIKKTKSSDGSLFVESMKKYDQIRKEKFFKTHNEISIAMGYHEND
jgi:MoaA/NifB/PqqE/SkfB family radical SAM enzyme